MNRSLQTIYLVRHGETEWSRSGRHTGLTDLPLNERGEHDARRLAGCFRGMAFAKTLSSPLRRALRTAELSGFGGCTEIDHDLVEWNYGDFEGRTTIEINETWPGWSVFRDGCPGGEMPDQVAQRADRVIARVRAVSGNVLLFSSGHFLRVLAARWLGLEPAAGRFFMLGTASISALSYEHDLSQPAIKFWDDTRHLVQSDPTL